MEKKIKLDCGDSCTTLSVLKAIELYNYCG